MNDWLLKDENSIVDAVFTVNGFSFTGSSQNAGIVFVRMKDYAQRQHADQKVGALVGRMYGHFASYKDALIIPINPPSFLNSAPRRASTSNWKIAPASGTTS